MKSDNMESAMHAGQTHFHFTPSSVGGLMDPAFLRAAMQDADGMRLSIKNARSPVAKRWLAVRRAIAVLFRLCSK
jgi:hypothetical protein